MIYDCPFSTTTKNAVNKRIIELCISFPRLRGEKIYAKNLKFLFLWFVSRITTNYILVIHRYSRQDVLKNVSRSRLLITVLNIHI